MNADRDRSEQPTGSDWRVQQVMHALINHEVDPATPYLARIRSLATFILDVIDAEPPHSAPQPPRSATNETGGHSGTGEAQGDAQERIQALEAEVAKWRKAMAKVRRTAEGFAGWEESFSTAETRGYANATRMDGQIILAILDADPAPEAAE